MTAKEISASQVLSLVPQISSREGTLSPSRIVEACIFGYLTVKRIVSYGECRPVSSYNGQPLGLNIKKNRFKYTI
jgi:hypothetical protein